MEQYQSVFARKEIKYLLSDEQYNSITERLADIAAVDQYGETTIRNIYFDTPDFLLVRESLDKPRYKEKLRLRVYGEAYEDVPAFVEIKKKFEGIVYKRRIGMTYAEAIQYLCGRQPVPQAARSQISSEIDYFLQYYPEIIPTMRITYNRIAWAGLSDPTLRLTFDTDLQWSMHLDLEDKTPGTQILSPGLHLMELKVSDAVHPEVGRILNELSIFPTSISKYGLGFLAYEKACAGKGITLGNQRTLLKQNAAETFGNICGEEMKNGQSGEQENMNGRFGGSPVLKGGLKYA